MYVNLIHNIPVITRSASPSFKAVSIKIKTKIGGTVTVPEHFIKRTGPGVSEHFKVTFTRSAVHHRKPLLFMAYCLLQPPRGGLR